jgi:uncharacterized protein YigE (DUF2233 family)
MRSSKRLSLQILLVFLLCGIATVFGVESCPGSGVVYVEKQISIANGGHQLRIVLVKPRECTLRVVDNPQGELSLGAAMEEHGCLAGVNGGYFHPGFTPLGLVIANGRKIHPLENAKLLSGLVVVNRGRVALLRKGEFKPGPTITEALQCGPFLIDHGRPVSGLNATKAADRTVVLSDGKGGCALLMAESVSLAEMARILATPGLVPELKIVRALNLDGGSSSGMWVGQPPVYSRELKRVRNFLGVVAR